MPEGLVRAVRAGVTLALAAFVVVAMVTADPAPVDRAEAIGERVRCPVCEGDSIADSPSGLARDMMALVRQRVEEGYSDEQIIAELLASYTEAQRLDPPLRPETVALWAIPALALGVGAWMLASRRREQGDASSRVESGQR